MENTIKILLAGAYIDFYVNKSKFDNYKTDAGKKDYVFRELNKIFESQTGKTINNIQIRDISITSNNFYGSELNFIPDLDYNITNQCSKIDESKNKLPIRSFHVDIVASFNENNLNDKQDLFFSLGETDKFILKVGSIKVV